MKKFRELIQEQETCSESAQRLYDKLERQFFLACQRNNIPTDEEVVLKAMVKKQEGITFYFFTFQDKRISPFMMVVPPGELILTEEPDNYVSLETVFGPVMPN